MKIDRVYEKDGRIFAVSKESPFYPDGKGGQLGDRGKIAGVRVLKVFERGGEIHHEVESRLEPGEYDFEIDVERRKEIARQHTAQHILSASFVKVADIDTVSFHMGEDHSTIDLNASPILDEVIEEVEDISNGVILENRKVLEHVVDREEVSKFPLRKPLSDKIKGKARIIEVEGFDWSACGGFHVSRTGEIGLVKIVDRERVKGGLTRVYFVAGMRALKDYRKRVGILKKLSKKLTSSPEEMTARIENMDSEIRSLRKKIDEIAEYCVGCVVEKILKKTKKIGNVDVVFYDGPEDILGHVFKRIVDRERTLLVASVENGYEIASNHVNVGKLINALREKIGGKGGGGKNRGRVIVDIDGEAFVEALESVLPEVIG